MRMESSLLERVRWYARVYLRQRGAWCDATPFSSDLGAVCHPAPFGVSSTDGPTVNPALYAAALQELDLDGKPIKVAVCDSLAPNIRGVFWKDGNGDLIVLINDATGTSNTLLHELRHVWQKENGYRTPTKVGLEADAQRYADMNEARYEGLVTRRG